MENDIGIDPSYPLRTGHLYLIQSDTRTTFNHCGLNYNLCLELWSKRDLTLMIGNKLRRILDVDEKTTFSR